MRDRGERNRRYPKIQKLNFHKLKSMNLKIINIQSLWKNNKSKHTQNKVNIQNIQDKIENQ